MSDRNPAPYDHEGCSQRITEPQTTSSSMLHYERGRELERRGRLVEMSNEYRIAVKLDPNFPEACIRLGYILQHLEDIQDEMKSLQEHLTIQPENTGDQYELAQVLWMLGRDVESIQLLEVVANSIDRRAESARDLLDEYKNHGTESILEWQYFPDDCEESEIEEL